MVIDSVEKFIATFGENCDNCDNSEPPPNLMMNLESSVNENGNPIWVTRVKEGMLKWQK